MKRLVMKLLGYLITLLMVATPMVGVANDRNDIEETIAARLALMKPVAHSKWVAGRAIEDTDREKVVIEQAVISGLQYGITTDSTTTFFEAQIEAAKAIQRYWFSVWQDEPPEGLAPDLTATIRPQLLELGDQILSQLSDTRSLPFARFQKATQIEGLSLAHQQALFQALAGIERYPSRWQQIQKSRILRVGTTLDYAPFSYLSEGGEREGLDIVLATQPAEFLGARLVWVRTSWPTLMKDFRSGAFDIGMSGISIIPSRAREGFFTTAYHEGGKTPITHCNLKTRFTSLDAIDRAGVRVIVNPGGTNERYVNTALKAATIVRHPDNETIFEALRAGKPIL